MVAIPVVVMVVAIVVVDHTLRRVMDGTGNICG